MEDQIIRAISANAEVRGFAAYTREMVGTAFERHKTSPVVTAALGRLLTAGAIMGIMQKGENDIMTLRIDGDGPLSTLTVTADSKGNVKGYPSEPVIDIPLKPNGKLDVSGAIGNGFLTVIKDMGLKEPYIGKTELVSGEIAEDMTYYFMASEQTPSSMGLGVLVDTDYSVKQAGGFLVQLMPFASDETIDKLEANLAKISSVTNLFEEGKSPKDILDMVLEGLEPEYNQEDIVPHFKCNCSRERVKNALASLNPAELAEMFEDTKTINVHCDFCNTDYDISAEEMNIKTDAE